MQISRAMAKELDETQVSMTLEHHQKPYTVTLPLPSLHDIDEKDIFDKMGLVMGLPARVGKLEPGSPAELAGLKKGDRIVSINDESMLDWTKVVEYVSKHPAESLQLGVKHDGAIKKIDITPSTKPDGKGYLGVYIDDSLLRKEKLSFIPAFSASIVQTYEYSWLTLKMIYFMMSGQASLEHISGPVSIAQVAGATAKVGLTYYLDFLAIISISLGLLNLLPIPMLDGGHLFYYLIEAVRRKPLSEGAQMIGLRIGLIILVSLMFVAFYNDILRLV
jgi:regulator of sigma E protease